MISQVFLAHQNSWDVGDIWILITLLISHADFHNI